MEVARDVRLKRFPSGKSGFTLPRKGLLTLRIIREGLELAMGRPISHITITRKGEAQVIGYFNP